MSQEVIDEFSGKYRFLSNFYYAPIKYNGIYYQSTEVAYQAMKCARDEDFEKFSHLGSYQAKRLGKTVTLRSDWEDIKLSLMKDLVYIKFTQFPGLQAQLLATGFTELIEGNDWNDTFWGVCNGVGENHLGKVLMYTRDLLWNGQQRVVK